MKKSRMFTFLQLVCGILAICGVYITALEYRELKTHVEWSTPAYYSLSQADIHNLSVKQNRIFRTSHTNQRSLRISNAVTGDLQSNCRCAWRRRRIR